jgi:hypothetical protein
MEEAIFYEAIGEAAKNGEGQDSWVSLGIWSRRLKNDNLEASFLVPYILRLAQVSSLQSNCGK